jgi:SlyX protein
MGMADFTNAECYIMSNRGFRNIMAERIEAAEIEISHLSRMIEDLSDEVARQGDQIDRLNARLQTLLDRLSKQHDGDDGAPPLEEQRPPHW